MRTQTALAGSRLVAAVQLVALLLQQDLLARFLLVPDDLKDALLLFNSAIFLGDGILQLL